MDAKMKKKKRRLTRKAHKRIRDEFRTAEYKNDLAAINRYKHAMRNMIPIEED